MEGKTVSVKEVISHYNIIGLGVGVAIGIAGKDFLFSLANDIVLPLVGNVIKTKFFDDYKFDGDKFVGALLTLLFVIGTVMFVLYVALKPLVKSEIQDEDVYRKDITDGIKAIVEYQKAIKKNSEQKD